MLGGQLKDDLMVFRTPPPNMYQNHDAARAAARKDYAGHSVTDSLTFRVIGGGMRVVTWPVRALWRRVRSSG